MKSVVSYPERGVGGNNKYRGNFPPQLVYDLHSQYGFEMASDYMCGSRTTEDAGRILGIKTNCYDLNCGFDVMSDEIKERNEFIIWHPPYWDIIKYSGEMYGSAPHPADLSHIKSYDDFMKMINVALMRQYGTLKTGGRMAILMGDIKKKGRLYSMLLDIVKPGTIENIVIKVQHNTMSGFKEYKTNNFIPIVHENLLILRKDNPYIESLKITKDYDFDIRDSAVMTWRDVVAAVLESHGRAMKLQELYKAVEHHKKAKSNKHYKEKIRQVVRQYKDFECLSSGLYRLAS